MTARRRSGVVWGLVRGNAAGWGSAEVVGALAGGAAAGRAFVAWELRAREPMLPMRLFRSRAFSAGNAAIVLRGRPRCSARVFFLAQFLQVVLGRGPLEAGLQLLPWTATLFFVAPVAGTLADRFGERPFLVAGPLLQAVGHGLDRADRRAPAWPTAQLVVPLVVAGVGISMAFPAAQNSVVGSVRRGGDRQGVGHQQHDARARRRVRHRDQRRRVRGGRRLRVPRTFTDGFAAAMIVSAGLSLLAALAGARRCPAARRPGPCARRSRRA